MLPIVLLLSHALIGAAVEAPRLVRRQISSLAEVLPAPSASKSVQCKERLESSYECKGTRGYDQSCIFHCAYLTPAEDGWVINLLMLEKSPSDPAISDWDMPAIRVENPVTVKVRRFESREELEGFVRGWATEHHPGLSVLFRALWQDRWAHAMFDGLYPAFVSLARFGLEKHSFTPLVLLSNYTAGLDCGTLESQRMGLSGAGIYTGTACQMENAIRLFGAQGESRNLIRVNALWERLRASKGALFFEHLVSGSGHLGEYASVTALPGTESASGDLLGSFADRLYAAHGLRPPQKRGVRAEPLRVLITANKRMSSEEVAVMSQLAAEGLDTVEMTGEEPSLNISFVDWSTVQPFSQQLQMLRESDVMISGIGTALFYSAFLPPGSVCINTGWKDATIPTYGEDILGMSNHRTRFLYMPLERVKRGISRHDVEQQILMAASLIAKGFPLPVDPEENLSIFGRIIRELGATSESSRKGLQGREQTDGGFLCHQRPTGQTSLSDLVFERTLQAKNLLFQLPRSIPLTEACQIDLTLLRRLKRKHNLTAVLNLEESSCECVACEACGLL